MAFELVSNGIDVDYRTYSELRALLRIRVENALARLVRDEKVQRGSAGGRPLYTGVDLDRAREQVAAREAIAAAKEPRQHLVDIEVDVLVEVIRASGLVVPHEADVVRRLYTRGVAVKLAQGRSVYAKYGLKGGKKRRSPTRLAREGEEAPTGDRRSLRAALALYVESARA